MHTSADGRLILRTQLQFDVNPNIKREVKRLAANKDMTIGTLILTALAETYPELRPYMKSKSEPLED